MARHHSLKDIISDEQEANLRKLAAYLLTLPADYPDFEMSNFVNVPGVSSISPAHVPACGTAACAVGHGPAAGFAPEADESWRSYSHRLFINTSGEPFWGTRHNAWEWCFGGEWSECDNTVHGAAKRILFMLESGLPEDFDGGSGEWSDFVRCYTDMVLA